MFKRLMSKKTLLIVIVLAVAYGAYMMHVGQKKSMFEEQVEEPTVVAEPMKENNMREGTGLASALLPKEVAKGDFGEFAPSEMLAGQNFLDPRQQIGFPETIGGALRNANQQVRSEPPAPKQSYTWNNSTITAADQRRALE
jgi:hypothetical protein